MGEAMRVSELYGLGVAQPSLEFLDVEVEGDTRVFVDPHAIRGLSNDWARECVSLMQTFWDEVIAAVVDDDRERGYYLLARLGESNEAHLGLSSGPAAGSGISYGLARDIFNALADSEAVTTGLLEDIEEAALFVKGVGHDRISDATINIIRRPLIDFTQEMAARHGIELIDGVDSGPMWDRRTLGWTSEHVSLPMTDVRHHLLLIPRAIVRKNATFDPGDYLYRFVLPHLQDQELSKPFSPLVRRRASKRGRPGELFVTKKSILEREPGKSTKQRNNEVTADAPGLLDAYRKDRSGPTQAPDHEVLTDIAGTPLPDWDALLAAVLTLPTGRADADRYHRAVQHLLTALLYPALDMPSRERVIHDGRKRIDITYMNVATEGFFWWMHAKANVPCPTVVVECKNYSDPISNPEMDQLTGRFSPSRGRLGLLCYRGHDDDKNLIIARCRDAARDGRGIVIALDDEDLKILVESRKAGEKTMFTYLSDRYRELI